jgi:hypothetical protein
LGDGFRPGINKPGSSGQIFGPERDQPPVKFLQPPAILMDDSVNFLGGGNIVAGSPFVAKEIKLEMICERPQ